MYKRRNTLMYDIRKSKEQNFKIIIYIMYMTFSKDKLIFVNRDFHPPDSIIGRVH